jgi:hypothetical protein
MKRREFLRKSGWLTAGLPFVSPLGQLLRDSAVPTHSEAAPDSRIAFATSDSRYHTVYASALQTLAGNIQAVKGYEKPVLIEGSSYKGIWQECAPQEAEVYSVVRPDLAPNNHLAFFAAQREDGQIPCWIRTQGSGFGQIQMVVPIAATAWEIAQRSHDSELLEKAYASCSRWDSWLRRYRDTRHTGLCEGFCTWDTGHDNSPRWAGMPNRCPDADARKCPSVASLPRLCPDLSATVYGGRVALAAMARALGKDSEATRWMSDAATIRAAILNKLYSPEDAAFYDLDAQNHFVRIRSDVISRVLGEHVVDQKLFNTIYERQIHNPKAFWAPYPLPSIALDDPAFVRPIPRNSWGGPSQALTALRAPRWMEYYGKPADLAHMMQQWVAAIVRNGEFLQQMDPITGEFTHADGDYSPAALVMLDFTWRLAGVRQTTAGKSENDQAMDRIEWNVHPQAKDVRSSYRLRLLPHGNAEIEYSSGNAKLLLNGKLLCATSSSVRLVSNLEGVFQTAVGIAPETTRVELQLASKRKHALSLGPNQSVAVSPV